MRTLVVSDLHLGRAGQTDLLRRADLRAPLLEALGRRRPVRDPRRRARAARGRAPRRDGRRRAVLRRRRRGARARQGADRARRQPRPRDRGGLDRRPPAERAGGLPRPRAALRARAGRARSRSASPRPRGPARLQFAYPGIWLRDDVYAIHGHYSDVHATVPTFERLAAGTMARYVAKLPEHGATAGRLRGGPQPALRLAARAHPARRPHGRHGRRQRVREHVREADRQGPPQAPARRSRSASATAPRCSRSTAPASARWRPASRPRRCAAAT